jgi:NAD(P)-dependent dehydrogenase (short-subunit alcohol dehydrogenase family)
MMYEMFKLNGRVAILTGATGFLGPKIALALCEAGAELVLVARDKFKLEELRLELKSKGFLVSTFSVDLTVAGQLDKFCDEITNLYTHIDILVNNAYSGAVGHMDGIGATDFEFSTNIGLTAPFRMAQGLLSLLEEAAKKNRGGSSIINIASMYGVVSPDPKIYSNTGKNNPPQYGAVKAGLIQLTRYLSCHLAPKNIRVNCISPGPFPPKELLNDHPDFHGELCNKVPLGRVGSPEELGGPVVFLASDAASYVTGANLLVDGGWTVW